MCLQFSRIWGLCMFQGWQTHTPLDVNVDVVNILKPCMVVCAQPPAPHPSAVGGQVGQHGTSAATESGHAGAQVVSPEKMQADAAEGLSRLQAYIRACGVPLQRDMQTYHTLPRKNS